MKYLKLFEEFHASTAAQLVYDEMVKFESWLTGTLKCKVYNSVISYPDKTSFPVPVFTTVRISSDLKNIYRGGKLLDETPVEVIDKLLKTCKIGNSDNFVKNPDHRYGSAAVKDNQLLCVLGCYIDPSSGEPAVTAATMNVSLYFTDYQLKAMASTTSQNPDYPLKEKTKMKIESIFDYKFAEIPEVRGASIGKEFGIVENASSRRGQILAQDLGVADNVSSIKWLDDLEDSADRETEAIMEWDHKGLTVESARGRADNYNGDLYYTLSNDWLINYTYNIDPTGVHQGNTSDRRFYNQVKIEDNNETEIFRLLKEDVIDNYFEEWETMSLGILKIFEDFKSGKLND